VTAAAAAVVYATMWIGWSQSWPWLNALDNWLLAGLDAVGQAHPLWVTCWNVFCTVFGPTVLRIVTVVPIIWLLLRRYLHSALFLVLCVELTGLVTEAAKHLANRPRPGTAMVSAYGTAFPSGHAVGVTAAVLGLLAVTSVFLAPRWRTVATVLGAVLVVAIGAGRVVLNVHHPSDVLAGWALGYLWYLACLAITRPTRSRASPTPRSRGGYPHGQDPPTASPS
jgi:membrane-associated phospholipid phosphatase